MQDKIIYWKSFFRFVFERFKEDKCLSVAAELTVTSLLALVPLMTVVFSLLALIPDFQNMADKLQELMFEYFVPATGESVQNYLSEFVGKAKKMSAVGFGMLIVTALLMMRTIDMSFNNIWHIKTKKSLVRTFLVYWAVLTLGPILLGTSLVVTSYLQSLPLVSDVVQQNSLWMTVGFPFLMETVTFALMFFVIPNRKIRPKHAMIASIIAAILFEVAKSGFAIFVTYFSTYQLIFGALATIPLFLIWIYLSWSIILFGAEICHGLFAFVVKKRETETHPFIQVLELLSILSENQMSGLAITEEKSINQDDWGIRERSLLWLERLIDVGIVAKLQNHEYCLKISRNDINFSMIYKVVNRQLPTMDEIEGSDISDEMKSQLTKLSSELDNLFSDKPAFRK